MKKYALAFLLTLSLIYYTISGLQALKLAMMTMGVN